MTRELWGKAKLKVYVLKSEILLLHGQGQNLEEIYNSFQSRLDIGKRTFKRHASAIIKEASLSSLTPTPRQVHATTLSVAGKPITEPITPSPVVDPVSSVPTAKPLRTGRTIIPGSSLKKSGFNDPNLIVVSDDLLDELYGTSNKPSSSSELPALTSPVPVTEDDDLS